MANSRKRPAGNGRKKKGAGRAGRRSWLWPAIVAGILLLTLLATFVIVVMRPNQRPAPPPAPVSRSSGPPIHYEEHNQGEEVVTLESPGKKRFPQSLQARKPGDKEAGRLPPVAIVIDDMGYQQQLDEELLQLDLNVTFAFLPHGPHTRQQAARARRLGRDVLLHFPMEAADQKWDPGPGVVTLAMNRAQLRSTFEENLRLVPLALGINNHMGSRFTQNQEAMHDFLGLVRDHHLFFLDSMTSRTSIGYTLAREMGVKTARRNVFLDNVREEEAITGQIRKILAVARKQGWAVGIGHPYPETLAALRSARSEILGRVRVVGISKLVH